MKKKRIISNNADNKYSQSYTQSNKWNNYNYCQAQH